MTTTTTMDLMNSFIQQLSQSYTGSSSSQIWLACAFFIFCCCTGASALFQLGSKRRQPTPVSSVVVITGCDSGFGLLATTVLSQAGYRVVSACLAETSCAQLQAIATRTVKCDVTNAADIAALVSTVEALLASDDQLCLWALINNAGVAPLGYVDWLSMGSFRQAMEVNYFGTVAVTKQCLPLLKRTRDSRIVNVSSVAGLGAGPMFAGYAASKHAVEGFSKSLRQELRPWNIHVVNVNPGFMRTPMVVDCAPKTLAEFENAPSDIQEQYGPDRAATMLRRMHGNVLAVGEDPQLVVDRLLAVLRARAPRLVNYTGSQASALRVFFALPVAVQDVLASWFVEVLGPLPSVLGRLQGQERGQGLPKQSKGGKKRRTSRGPED